MNVTQNDGQRGGSTIDGRATRHPGYQLSQTIRKRIEEHFGVGRIRQTIFRGLQRVDQHFKLTITASNHHKDGLNIVRGTAGALE